MELDVIHNMDCLEGLRSLPDKCVDLIVTDPPYEFNDTRGGGTFGSKHRTYHAELDPLSKGVTKEVLDEMVRVMKKINIYIWCNKNQLRQYIDYFDDLGCSMDLLTWHKTNPVPTCSNSHAQAASGAAHGAASGEETRPSVPSVHLGKVLCLSQNKVNSIKTAHKRSLRFMHSHNLAKLMPVCLSRGLLPSCAQ